MEEKDVQTCQVFVAAQVLFLAFKRLVSPSFGCFPPREESIAYCAETIDGPY
jgi:hypothetical protein